MNIFDFTKSLENQTQKFSIVFLIVVAGIFISCTDKSTTSSTKRSTDSRLSNANMNAGYVAPSSDPARSDYMNSNTAPSGSRFVMDIPAEPGWYDTGMDVLNRRITIEYTSGSWRDSISAPWYDGLGRKTTNPNQLILPTAKMGSLIGKVPDGEPFYIGNYYDGKPGTGHLVLGMNDKNKAANEGVIQVIITFW